ncbi:MAG: hypothetical protein JO108_10095 [Acidobacteriaceae bacterium]|nr:hypothetical protein [Acidobacteriaceae bacterium]
MAEEEKKTHIEIHITRNGEELTNWYAVTPTLLAAAEKEIFKVATQPTPEKLGAALERNGAVLDREDGPARVYVQPAVYREEEWYRDGKLHREGGPAHTVSDPNGFCLKVWYRNGERHRDDGPAYVSDGPIGHVEAWFKNGCPITPGAKLNLIPGVKVHPPKP